MLYKINKKIFMNIENGIKVCGKWILAGEYAVLKSYPALVFPLSSYFIELKYQRKNISFLKIIEEPNTLTKTSTGRDFVSFFDSVLDQALQNIAKSRNHLKGVIRLHPHILFSAGVGASAVICVLIAKLFYYLNWLKEEELFPFCHKLENTLHGMSSGVDIAAVLSGKPILYRMSTELDHSSQKEGATQFQTIIKEFKPVWKPFIFLSHLNQSSSTKVNVENMCLFWKKEAEKADQLNRQMEMAVLKAKEGLKEKNKEKGLILLKDSFSLSEECFKKWGLINKNMKNHIQFLKNQGALAAKPTGSGAGGCVLSLWSELPPVPLRNKIIYGF